MSRNLTAGEAWWRTLQAFDGPVGQGRPGARGWPQQWWSLAPPEPQAWKWRTTGSPEVTTLAQVDLCIYSLLFANFQNSVSNYLPKISTKPPPSKQAGARVIGSLVFLACHALVRDSTYTWVLVKLSGAPWGSWAWRPFCLPFLISKTLAFRPSLSSKGQIGTIAN